MGSTIINYRMVLSRFAMKKVKPPPMIHLSSHLNFLEPPKHHTAHEPNPPTSASHVVARGTIVWTNCYVRMGYFDVLQVREACMLEKGKAYSQLTIRPYYQSERPHARHVPIDQDCVGLTNVEWVAHTLSQIVR